MESAHCDYSQKLLCLKRICASTPIKPKTITHGGGRIDCCRSSDDCSDSEVVFEKCMIVSRITVSVLFCPWVRMYSGN